MMKLLVLSGLVAACLAFECSIGGENQKLEKMACIKRNKGVFSDMLSTNRDSSAASFTGQKLDWKQFEQSLQTLACDCAAKAKEQGYVAIALGFFGECHGTKDQSKYERLLTDKNTLSNGCINHAYKSCRDGDSKCVGRGNAEYVYTFPSKAPESKPNAPEVVNGGYSEWSDYTSCSASCGGGVQARERACNNPLPENGGIGCEELGDATESRKCNTTPCPVNGKYGAWENYGACSKSCGGGSQKRTRKCDSPSPAHGGSDCEGVAEKSKVCNTQACPVNGEYGAWESYGSCSKTCGGGTKTRTRKCDSPSPAHGGAACSGSATESKACNTQPCLESAICHNKYTNFADDGKGKPVYLDRHSLHCPSGYVMNYIRLERNSDHNKIRYRYKCCRSQLSCSDSEVTNSRTYNGGGNKKKAYYLDRQTINCNKKGISYLKLDRSGDYWNYKYDCCKVGYSSASTHCYNTNTNFSDDGGGEAFFIDRHAISCNYNYAITKMRLVRNSDHDKIRYDYTCCKINRPAKTN